MHEDYVSLVSLKARIEDVEMALDLFRKDRISYFCENLVPHDAILNIEKSIWCALAALRAALEE